MGAEVDSQVAAPAEMRTPTGTERTIAPKRVRMEGMATERPGSNERTHWGKKRKNRLDTNRPSHGRLGRQNDAILAGPSLAQTRCSRQEKIRCTSERSNRKFRLRILGGDYGRSDRRSFLTGAMQHLVVGDRRPRGPIGRSPANGSHLERSASTHTIILRRDMGRGDEGQQTAASCEYDLDG